NMKKVAVISYTEDGVGMALIRPFAALRPVAARAADVAAPPYDVMSRDEAKQMAAGRPWSFLHISRPEIDLPDDVDAYDAAVYTKGHDNLQQMQAAGILQQDAMPGYYMYRLTMGEHVQTGLVAVASVQAYNADRIKKHEFTRPVKEQDRVHQINRLNAQTGPVFLVYPAHEEVDAMLAAAAQTEPAVDMTAADGVRHQLWLIQDDNQIGVLTDAFAAMPALYVADGHHRSAAAARVATERSQGDADAAHHYFLSVIFPHNQVSILDYNRLVRDLHGLTVEEFLARVSEQFRVRPLAEPVKPDQPGVFGMYVRGQWYQLQLRDTHYTDDPVARLDVSLLTDHLIEPILGIQDPRRDPRIDFVGGIRGLSTLQARVDSGDWAVAFALYPVSVSALMAVADSGQVMPPKSTWFEPKLADGLVSHLL
ncbi:MAG: DUF1015 family protein, partial [Pseudomonadota bacterium]